MAFTPAIQQYIDMKKQHSDCVLFFRMGDFYETFFDDAKTCSKVLDLVLTSKNKDAENPVPMAGIPYHSVDKYIPKLISHGYKVAIAEQTTQPVPGKIVEREVTQIITPATYIHEHKKDFSYLLSVHFSPSSDDNNYHIAWGDFSVGEYRTKSFSDTAQMQKFILMVQPTEIVVDIDFPEKDSITAPLQQDINCLISVNEVPIDPALFVAQMCKIQTIASFGKALEDGRLHATGLLFYYLKHTQNPNPAKDGAGLSNIVRVALHSQDNRVLMDDITIKNLEVFSSSYEGSEKYSLIGILDTTKTFAGARLLRSLLANPINDLEQIARRLDMIEHYQKNIDHTKYIHNSLSHVLDISKVVTSILYKKLLPSQFVKLRATMRIFLEKQEMLDELIRLGLSAETLKYLQHLLNFLNQLIKDDEEYKDDIGFIRDAYDQGIDRLRQIAYHSDELLLSYQQELSKLSGISNVKLKFVMNQGYFIEIINKDVDTFEGKIKPSGDVDSDGKFDLVRRNTLKGAQRYTSPYLDEIQEKILEAKDELIVLEFALLDKAKEKIGTLTKELNEFAEKVAWLDVCSSQALLAKEKGYIRPELLPDFGIEIVAGRHSVIEEFLPQDQQFIPNDLSLRTQNAGSRMQENDDGFLRIITGPNMGGKSTYLRQNALLVLMAHCGLFVPAQSAKMGLVDGIFARVGSGDNIAKNQSTFMTEMIEVANILNNATEKSFVIFDELGRGTATYDGLALTKSILEYIAKQVACKTLIATHYHELIQLEKHFSGIKNYSVSVYETDKEVVFMKKIVPGGASKSYGIDVAKIAGIPDSIVEQAKIHLDSLENEATKEYGTNNTTLPLSSEDTLRASHYEKVKSILENYDLDNVTPLQALQLLSKIRDELGN